MYPKLYFAVDEDRNKAKYFVPIEDLSYDNYVRWVLPDTLASLYREFPSGFNAIESDIQISRASNLTNSITTMSSYSNEVMLLVCDDGEESELCEVFPYSDTLHFAQPLIYSFDRAGEFLVRPPKTKLRELTTLLRERHAAPSKISKSIKDKSEVLHKVLKEFDVWITERIDDANKYPSAWEDFATNLDLTLKETMLSCGTRLTNLPNSRESESISLSVCFWYDIVKSYLEHAKGETKKALAKLRQGFRHQKHSEVDIDLAKEALYQFADEYLFVANAAKYLGVSRSTIQRYAVKGDIGVWIDGQYQFSKQELDEFKPKIKSVGRPKNASEDKNA